MSKENTYHELVGILSQSTDAVGTAAAAGGEAADEGVKLTDAMVMKFRKAFNAVDADRSGELEVGELVTVGRSVPPPSN
jgi:hypothetical protein